jgi:hypothetical protein
MKVSKPFFLFIIITKKYKKMKKQIYIKLSERQANLLLFEGTANIFYSSDEKKFKKVPKGTSATSLINEGYAIYLRADDYVTLSNNKPSGRLEDIKHYMDYE